MAATKKLRYSIDEDQHTASWEAGADVEYDELPAAEFDEGADPEYEVEADPDYDEPPQAEFDEAAQPDYEVAVADPSYDEVPVGATVEQMAEPELVVTPAAGFAFELGRLALPLTQQQPHEVVWRGHLKERHPVTGLVQRVPVYRLADGYWDCYREEELQVVAAA